jgi:N-methylhydantoinase B
MKRGDVFAVSWQGGGGFGDPLERDPARVVADIGEGYVTPAAAEAIYGVVLRDGAPDAAATAAQRAKLRAGRILVRVVAGAGLDAEAGRQIRLGADTATRLGVGPGAVVELVNRRGAPLRAWVAGFTAKSAAGSSPVAELAPAALHMLAIVDNAELEVRAVHSGMLG